MPYVTGTANSEADLLTAIRNACTSNGWTLNNDILSKGGAYARVWSPATGCVSVVSGRGETGGASSTLTGQSNAALRGIGGTIVGQAFTYPMTYHIHLFANPDEVYLVVNYAVSFHQWLGFGRLPTPGIVGTGNFYFATRQSNPPSVSSLDNRIFEGVGSTNWCPFPFGEYPTGGFVGGYTGFDHSMDTDPEWRAVTSAMRVNELLLNSPNTWNGQTVLVPAQVWDARATGISLVGEFHNMRYAFIDNYDPGAILTLGPDKWRLYPTLRKGSRSDNNGSGALTSGSYALALRYDGP